MFRYLDRRPLGADSCASLTAAELRFPPNCDVRHSDPRSPLHVRLVVRFAQIAVTLPYDEREVSASRELSETTVQSSLGMFDCLMARVPKRIWAHTPFAVHPFAKIPL
jgi:hypothetical protein